MLYFLRCIVSAVRWENSFVIIKSRMEVIPTTKELADVLMASYELVNAKAGSIRARSPRNKTGITRMRGFLWDIRTRLPRNLHHCGIVGFFVIRIIFHSNLWWDFVLVCSARLRPRGDCLPFISFQGSYR